MKRSNATYILFFVILLAGAFFVEQLAYFQPLKNALRTRTVPPQAVNYGDFGRISTQLGFFTPVPNDEQRFLRTAPLPKQSRIAPFPKKRQVGGWLFAVQAPESRTLSRSRVPEKLVFEHGVSVLSIAIDDQDLIGPDGIFTNNHARGKDFERLAAVSYYENGHLQFETHAGLRLHGGKSRELNESFRVYFRREYGARHVPGDLVFNSLKCPIERLVVRRDRPVHEPFTSCLAFDISEKLGCSVPAHKPAVVILNGKPLGFYFLTEHLGRKQWEQHTGHSEFDFFRFKSTSDNVSVTNYAELVHRFSTRTEPFDRDFVSEHCDTENLADYMIAISFCGTTDNEQGVAFRNRKASQPRWSWINWDMDHSFIDFYKTDGDARPPWEQEALQLMLRHEGYDSFRISLFFKLLTEDPQYAAYVLSKYVFALNHLITDAFFAERIENYQRIAEMAGEDGDLLLKPKREFLKHRPRVVREQLGRLFKTSAFRKYTVTGPPGIQYVIDGHEYSDGYVGYYCDKVPIRLRVTPGTRSQFSHWLVNGKKWESAMYSEGETSIFVPETDVIITPVFE